VDDVPARIVGRGSGATPKRDCRSTELSVVPALRRRAESCSPCGAKTVRISPDLRSAYGVNPWLHGPLRRIHGAKHRHGGAECSGHGPAD
jgi:hypothetical protein